MYGRCFLFLLAVAVSIGVAAKQPTTVAVVVDPVTYDQARSEVDSYVNSITADDRKGILLIDRWGVPDSLRAAFMEMYLHEMLEGVVLVGDIPVAMVRDAQHLCSAFKMNQKFTWERSSVPSDRFYDDFGLAFDFIRRDEKRGGLFYYSLRADGRQTVHCDIYSSRIKPANTPDKYKQIKDYLKKAVEAKSSDNTLDKAMFFAGHGYNSESMFARMEEHNALMEQIPALNGPRGRLDFIDHSFDEAVKYRLLKVLSDDDLDLAVLHHHGASDMQYMNGSPYTSNPDGWLRLARNYFRGKMANASNPEESRKYYLERYGIPEKWLDEATDKELIVQDSLYAASMDISLDDLKKARLNAKVVVFDACFNGAFIEDDYVAANYLFNAPNQTVVARAHSVNTLQDKWEDELIGLLGRGVCAGNWAKLGMDLDTHLFGDPTFCFGRRTQVDKLLSSRSLRWQKYLKCDDAELRCLALKELWRSGEITCQQLYGIQSDDPARTVRLEAMICAAESHVPGLASHLTLGLRDNYELTARLAAKYAGRNRSPELIPVAVEQYADPLTTIRVLFQLKNYLNYADTVSVVEAFGVTPYWKGAEAEGKIVESIKSCQRSEEDEIANLLSEAPVMRDARLFVRKQRNDCNAAAVDPMLQAYRKSSDKELKRLIAETLGWYSYSYRREDVIVGCASLLDSEKDPELASELRKTIARLK